MAQRFRDAYQVVTQRTRGWVLPFLVTAYLLLAFRLFWFIRRHAVDLFFYDQWNYLKTALNQAGFWEGFWTPLGPHRLGLAYPLYQAALNLGDYSNIYLVYLVGLLALLNSLLFLALKRRIQGAFYLSDVFVPLVFFDLNQHALYFTNPNIAVHHLPFTFLILLAGYFVLRPARWLRILVPLAIPLVVFTGNGFFVGLGAGLYAFYRYLAKGRARHDLFLAIMVFLAVSAYLWTAHYVSFDCAGATPQSFKYYVFFIKGMLLNGLVIGLQTSLLSWGVFLGLGIALFWAFWFSQGRYRQVDGYPLFFLYTALFVAATLISRWCYGLAITESSRYIPHVTLSFMALGFLRFRNNRLMHLIHGGLLALFFIYAQYKFSVWRAPMVEKQTRDMRVWRACYLQTGSVEQCNAKTNFRIYPKDNAHFNLSAQLERLAKHNPDFKKDP